jgi:hypothetical protein
MGRPAGPSVRETFFTAINASARIETKADFEVDSEVTKVHFKLSLACPESDHGAAGPTGARGRGPCRFRDLNSA